MNHNNQFDAFLMPIEDVFVMTGRGMKQRLAALAFALKYQTVSVVDAIDSTILAYENCDKQ